MPSNGRVPDIVSWSQPADPARENVIVADGRILPESEQEIRKRVVDAGVSAQERGVRVRPTPGLSQWFAPGKLGFVLEVQIKSPSQQVQSTVLVHYSAQPYRGGIDEIASQVEQTVAAAGFGDSVVAVDISKLPETGLWPSRVRLILLRMVKWVRGILGRKTA